MITGFKQVKIMGHPTTVIMDDAMKPGTLRLLSNRDLITLADKIHERMVLDLIDLDTFYHEGNQDGTITNSGPRYRGLTRRQSSCDG